MKKMLLPMILACMALLSLISFAAESEVTPRQGGLEYFNEQWYARVDGVSGWATQAGPKEKDSASSVWIESTTAPHFTAHVMGYNGSRYTDCSHGYTYGVPTGGHAYMYNWVYEEGYPQAAVKLILTDPEDRYTRAVGYWQPDI